jgi:hypothetical protein
MDVSSHLTCRFSARVSALVADSHLRCRGRRGRPGFVRGFGMLPLLRKRVLLTAKN